LTAALLIYLQAQRPMSAVETVAFTVCVVGGAVLGVWPLVLRDRAALKRYEVSELTSTLSQIQRSEEVAQNITNATGQWHAIQEQAVSTLAAAREVAGSMASTQQEFRTFFDRASDAERNNLRLEVNKLRRAEADWLQTLVRVLDHVYALYAAGVRSGQTGLIEQFANFQNACRDAARRVGLVPVLVAPGASFDAEVHQLLNPDAAVPAGATVAEMLATGYAFQGQLLRRALVVLNAPAQAAPTTTTLIESFSSLPPSQEPPSEPAAPTDQAPAGPATQEMPLANHAQPPEQTPLPFDPDAPLDTAKPPDAPPSDAASSG